MGDADKLSENSKKKKMNEENNDGGRDWYHDWIQSF